MSSQQPVDFLLIGHFARDRIVVDGKAETSCGGGVYYGAVALARLGFRVVVATRLHPDDLSHLQAVREAGVQVYASHAEQTSGIENIYDSKDMERRITHPLGFAGRFSPEEIPRLSARIQAIVPIIAGEVDLDLLEELAERGPIALDIQGFVRVREGDKLVFRPWAELERGLSRVTYLKTDRAEAELLTGTADLEQAARALAALGPKEVVITESAGLTVVSQGEVFKAPFTPRSLAGRTGRGDTAFATYLGWRLRTPPAEACRWAAAITTLKQERPGPWDGDLDAARKILGRGRI
ncbi:MAG: hypothetical protein JW797_06880 [Bradymonadales bacterium]|nr:hypothetical protein [Bradymonadales bacterium]